MKENSNVSILRKEKKYNFKNNKSNPSYTYLVNVNKINFSYNLHLHLPFEQTVVPNIEKKKIMIYFET